LSIVLSRDVDQPTAPTPSGGGTVETDGEMDASFAIILNLPKCFGSNEAKKLIRELKTKLTGEPPLVIVDLSRVTEMDCAGLDGLLVCMQEIAKQDGAIQVRAISPEAATLLELCRMDRLLQKFPSMPPRTLGFAVATIATAPEMSCAALQPQLIAA
jgi:anti-anti-sigma factor